MNIATQLLPLFLANLSSKARGIFYRVLAVVILLMIADYLWAASTGIPWLSTHVVSGAVLAGTLGISGVGHVVADKNRPSGSDPSLSSADLEADAQSALDDLISGSVEVVPALEPSTPAAPAPADPSPAPAYQGATVDPAAPAPQVDPATGLALPGAAS